MLAAFFRGAGARVGAGAFLAISLGTWHPAEAQDAPPHAGPRWSGFYAGAAAGGEWTSADWRTTGVFGGFPPAWQPVTSTFAADGVRAGLFAGWQQQIGKVVWGVEVDAGRSSADDSNRGIPGTWPTLAGSPDTITVSHGYDASARLRLGFLVTPALLAYATGGVAAAEIQTTVSCPGIALSWCIGSAYEKDSRWRAGWTIGAGFEWALAGGWFTRGEYRYSDYGSADHVVFAGDALNSVQARTEHDSHRLTLGLGYKF